MVYEKEKGVMRKESLGWQREEGLALRECAGDSLHKEGEKGRRY